MIVQNLLFKKKIYVKIRALIKTSPHIHTKNKC